VKLAIFLAIVVCVFAPLNLVTIRSLLRFHPRRRRLIVAVAAIANLLWPILPLLQRRTAFFRLVRSTLGPPWFAWLLFTIVYSALIAIVFLVWLVWKRVSREPRPFAAFARPASALFLGILALATVIGVVQALVPLRVEHVPVAIAGLDPSLEGEKIVLLADLHVGLFTRPSRLQQIFTTAAAQRPALVAIAGDLFDDDPYFAPKLLAATRFLDRTTPLVAVLGNHEMYANGHDVIAALRGTRIRLLVNQGVSLSGLWIAGMSDFAGRGDLAPDLDAALAGRRANELPLVLVHQPRGFDAARARHLPLTLAAHTHGGQFGCRPLHWSLAGLFLPFDMGLYRRGTSQLYVNTGTGYWLLPFRLGMTPEITVIELRPGR
jgi:predicted MPP superfamily phosphohydrolase